MNKAKCTVLLIPLLLVCASPSFAAGTNDVFGVWGAVTLQGDFKLMSHYFV